MKIVLDLAVLRTKDALLSRCQTIFPEMYGRNYDALTDAAGGYPDALEILLVHSGAYEDPEMLRRVFAIIAGENPRITVCEKP